MSAPISYDEAEANRRLRAALAVVDAARAFRATELRMLNYRNPEYAQNEADHLAARRALRDTLAAYDAATAEPEAATA